jgi:hypothetical protein
MFFHIRCFDSRRLNLNNAFIVCVIWSMEIFELNTLDFRILLCSVAIERGIFNPRMFMRVVNTLRQCVSCVNPNSEKEWRFEWNWLLFIYNCLIQFSCGWGDNATDYWSYLFECARTKTYLIRWGIFYAVLCSQC